LNSITQAYGTISASGGAIGGLGGNVETSGHLLKIDGIKVNTLAFDGSAGNWLLDPYNIVINTTGFTYSESTSSGTTTFISNGQTQHADNSYIDKTVIVTALGSNNVTILSDSGWDIISQGDGTINYTGSTTRTLTLNSGRNISLYYDSPTYPGGISGSNLNLVLQAAGTVTIDAAINVGGNVSITSTGLSGSGNITLASSKTLTVTQSGDSTYSGVISGAGGITKTGSGALTLSGNSTYSGSTTISAGTLRFAPSSGFSMTLSGSVINNSNVEYEAANSSVLFLSGATSGSGTWLVNSASASTTFTNRLVFSGSATTSGQITVTNFGNFWLEGSSINSTSAIYLN
jgi:autotransporter-associated beta strand protein